MPVTKSAKKALKQDRTRQQFNKKQKLAMKAALKKAKATPTEELVRVAVKATDKAAKNSIIHKNKASRIKSLLSKLLSGDKTVKAVVTPKKAKKKTPIKKTLSTSKKK